MKDAREAGVAAFLVKPVSEEDLLPAVEIALSQKEKMDSLKQDIKQLKQSIEERKVIEKAKGIVMQAYSLNEEEAYKKMREAEHDCRIPLSKLAACMLHGGCWNHYLVRHRTGDGEMHDQWITSVGLDIGTSTTKMVISRLKLVAFSQVL